MRINEIKKKMISYEDYYGYEFLDVEAIKNAKTKEELSDLIDSHDRFIEDMCNDAQSSLGRFRKDLGL